MLIRYRMSDGNSYTYEMAVRDFNNLKEMMRSGRGVYVYSDRIINVANICTVDVVNGKIISGS